ncbi:MAG: hypothetical protein Q8R32_00670 [bacterium]|nr:hypothetical protein [bacterium]
MKMDLGDGLEIEIKPVKVETEPPVFVWQVHLENASKNASWAETLATRELLEAFLRGMEAAASMISQRYLPRPRIPRAPEL